MNSYSVIASHYDKFTQNDCDYESWSQYLYAAAKENNVKHIVDLACGTGKMTALLCKKGFDVVGVDNSKEMLNVAVSKCKAKFILQDMSKLALTRLCDMAVCVNDGVNYVKPERLCEFFARVASQLKAGAPFVFDVSSEYKLTQIVADNVFYYDNESETLLWTNKLKQNCVEMSLTLFEREGSAYLRRDESHTQYIHSESSVKNALEKAGFTLKQVSADYGKPLTANSARITFYAIKN